MRAASAIAPNDLNASDNELNANGLPTGLGVEETSIVEPVDPLANWKYLSRPARSPLLCPTPKSRGRLNRAGLPEVCWFKSRDGFFPFRTTIRGDTVDSYVAKVLLARPAGALLKPARGA